MRRAFDVLLRRRGAAVGATLLLTAVLGGFASRVRPDFSIEMAFPRFDHSRVDYERYKRDFPYDDATALVVVEADDIFTTAGLRRLAALEQDLARIEGVVDTQGLATVRDIVSDGSTITIEPLVTGAELSDAAMQRVRETATSSALFAWKLASPDGRATTIQVTLAPQVASKDVTRTAFLLRAREVLRRHDDAAQRAGAVQRLTLSGLPVIRSQFTELIGADLSRLFPIAIAVTLLLLYTIFRSFVDVAAGLVTILFSVIWMVGVMGIFGIPLQVMTQITPIIVMIVSISDTAHIISDFREGRRSGMNLHEALVEACTSSALPCLLTEVTIAGGFCGLLFNDMIMIQQFGLATAAGAMLAWLANVTVLPLTLSFLATNRLDVSPRELSLSRTLLDRFIGWVAGTVVRRPRAIVAVTFLIVFASAALALRVGREYYSYDDLRPGGAVFKNIRTLEHAFGGSVPLAIFVEPAAGTRTANAMLEPEALSLIDRMALRLRGGYPDEMRNLSSIADYLRKGHALFADAGGGALPASRRLAAQELSAIDDARVMRNVISADRATAAIFVMVPDRGSSRASAIIAALRREFDREQALHPYRITITGIYGLADGIYRSLVGGLLKSLGWAIVISFVIFALVLRSVRLALIALVPNLLPLFVTLGVMALLRIDLKPTTVIIFSIALVIADDDTIQYLTRFRDRYALLAREGHASPHEAAALDTLRHSGPPMFATALSVAVGFSALLFSKFLGLANLGLVTGLSLLAAFFADVFLTPLLLMHLKPRIRVTGLPPARSDARPFG